MHLHSLSEGGTSVRGKTVTWQWVAVIFRNVSWSVTLTFTKVSGRKSSGEKIKLVLLCRKSFCSFRKFYRSTISLWASDYRMNMDQLWNRILLIWSNEKMAYLFQIYLRTSFIPIQNLIPQRITFVLHSIGDGIFRSALSFWLRGCAHNHPLNHSPCLTLPKIDTFHHSGAECFFPCPDGLAWPGTRLRNPPPLPIV